MTTIKDMEPGISYRVVKGSKHGCFRTGDVIIRTGNLVLVYNRYGEGIGTLEFEPWCELIRAELEVDENYRTLEKR